MIEDFEVYNIKKFSDYLKVVYKFKLNGELYFSNYDVYQADSEILINEYFYIDSTLGILYRHGHFDHKVYKEIKDIILKSKEVRLRHLLNPYKILEISK